MPPRRPLRLALDQNFPTPILAALAEFIVDVELIPLRKIDQRLSTLDDRTSVIALHQLGFEGLVTNNYKMLKNPKELAATVATKLTVFAIEGVGHDPIRATGFVRIESLVKAGNQMRVLDLHDRSVRAEVMEFDGAQVSALYEGPLARDYR